MGGKISLVPTPIGNLDDVTIRAINTLREVDCILCEDTRHTGKLLSHHGISNRLQSFHQHNEHRALEAVLDHLRAGAALALCSDAGTPGISDPGFLLVRACVAAGIDVECLPGATAFVPALVTSGLPCDRFYFEGFLPHKKGRQKRLSALLDMPCTVVLYESPHRVGKLLDQLDELGAGHRHLALCREISKLHEETLRGTVNELQSHLEGQPARGEYVVVLGAEDQNTTR